MKKTFALLMVAFMAMTVFAQKPTVWGFQIGSQTLDQLESILAKNGFSEIEDDEDYSYIGEMEGIPTIVNVEVDESDVVHTFNMVITGDSWKKQEPLAAALLKALTEVYAPIYELVEEEDPNSEINYRVTFYKDENAVIFDNEAQEDGSYMTTIIYTTVFDLED